MISGNLFWMIIIPLASAPFIYLGGRITSSSFVLNAKYNISRWLALFAILVCWIPAIRLVRAMQTAAEIGIHDSQIHIRFDGISLVITLCTLLLGTITIFFSGRYLSNEEGEEKFYSLFLILIGSIIGLSCAADLFNLWVWFEVMAISTYTMVSFYRNQAGALEAGVKYLVQSALGSAFIVVGIALVFGQTGSLDLDIIKGYYLNTPSLLAGGALFFIGFGIKAAIVPLHTWLPDAHSQAPSGMSAMLSGIVIEAGLVALLRTLGALAHVSNLWGCLFLGLGAINMLVGNLMALRQTQVKRMLAYSSISHMGYMLTGLGIAIYYHVSDGASGVMFHLINHALMKGLAFLAAGAFLYILILGRGKHDPLQVKDLCGAAVKYPIEAFTLSVALLALAGLPPLAGFMSKWVIFTAGFETKEPWIYAAMIFMALNSVLSLGYYAPVINQLYQREPSSLIATGDRVPVSMRIPLIALALAVILLGFYPTILQWLYNLGGKSLMALF